MTIDTRTDAEKRYDALKDGSAYVTSQPAPSLAYGFEDLLVDLSDSIDDLVSRDLARYLVDLFSRVPVDALTAAELGWLAQQA